jgi:hypothetical protein
MSAFVLSGLVKRLSDLPKYRVEAAQDERGPSAGASGAKSREKTPKEGRPREWSIVHPRKASDAGRTPAKLEFRRPTSNSGASERRDPEGVLAPFDGSWSLLKPRGGPLSRPSRIDRSAFWEDKSP